jgi:asparagine synthase (glutamine-hydrolysing)
LQGHGENLIAFTSVPRSDPSQYVDAHRFGDETQLAQATAIQAGNVEHQFIKSEAITPLAGIQQMLGVHDDPGHAAGNQYWIAALLQAARQRQVGVLLTGQMGNATISWAGGGENFFPLLWRGEVGAFWRAFEKLRQDASLGRLHSVRRFLLRPLLLPLWVAVRQRWRPRRAVWLGYSAIRPDFARSFQLSQQMAAAGYHPGFVSPDPIQQRLLIIQPGQNVLGASWLEKGAAYGLEVRDPTQDRRLIEFCLAVPEDQYQRNGEDRWLIRRAMRGYLPEAVRLNTRRGLQAADLGERVLAQRLEVEAALAQLQRHDLARQILDLPRMAGVLASLQRGLTPQNSADCSAVLLRGLMVGFFLLRF